MNKIDKIWTDIWEQGFRNFPTNLPIHKLLKYSSHIPLLLSVMEVFSHNQIVELGSGFFSTPIFYHNYVDKFVTVEDDKDWYDKIVRYYEPKEGFEAIYSGLLFWDEKPYKPTFSEITAKQQRLLIRFYESVKEHFPTDIMFVDQIKYGRSVSIDILGKYTNVLIYHDAQHKHRFYRDSVDKMVESGGYKHFSYKIERNTTNMVIKDSIDFDSKFFESKIEEYEMRYYKALGDRFDDLKYVKDIESVFIQI